MKNENRVIFITGASSGIGLETARYFYNRKWTVIATMRHPEKRRTPLHELGLLDLFHLDVLDRLSIQSAVKQTLEKYQKIDVLVNNAGYAVCGPFECTSEEQVTRQFNTNVFGLMEVVREFLPLFRRQKDGVIINIASMGGRISFPLFSLYNSTKWAVEGFSEALQYELKPLNIRVKIIEPGVIKTDFYARSMDTADISQSNSAYAGILKRGRKLTAGEASYSVNGPEAVARTIYQAASDSTRRLRYIAGNDARLISGLRRLLPEGLFYKILEGLVLE